MKRPKDWLTKLLFLLDRQVTNLNTSKIFAGIMVMTINIASKFVKFKFSRGMENYLKYSFSRDVLVFCIVWMGSRDIYIATAVTLLFVFLVDVLLNEESAYCMMPETFVDYSNMKPTPEDVKWAKTLPQGNLRFPSKPSLQVKGLSNTCIGSYTCILPEGRVLKGTVGSLYSLYLTE